MAASSDPFRSSFLYRTPRLQLLFVAPVISLLVMFSRTFARPTPLALVPGCILEHGPFATRSSRGANRSTRALRLFSESSDCTTASTVSRQEKISSPWTDPQLSERSKRKRRGNTRFRQHVNPLSRKYQQETELSEKWPQDVFSDCSKQLHIDIGCGKGGFLLDLAKQEPKDGLDSYNYLGLEIRPLVAQYARDRVAVHHLQGKLDYVGCNANVDLSRVLRLYQKAALARMDDDNHNLRLTRVTIQFPDPHFKSHHAKRRVVTPQLIDALAVYMPTNAVVFLQSDVQSVLDDMRLQFRERAVYFEDMLESKNDYLSENFLGVPTEREVSVLDKGLPVYRAVFTRTSELLLPATERIIQDVL